MMREAYNERYSIFGFVLFLLGVIMYFTIVYHFVEPINFLNDPYKILVALLTSLMVITLSSVYLSYYQKEKVLGLGAALFLITVISLIYMLLVEINLAYITVIELLFLLSITLLSLSKTWIDVDEHLFNRVRSFGIATKSLSFNLAIIWIINKLITLSIVSKIFINQDTLLAVIFFVYIMGSVIESFGVGYRVSYISSLKSGLTSLFTSSFIVLIVSYILMGLNLVGPNWSFYHDKLLSLVLISLAISILAYILLPTIEHPVGRKTFFSIKKISTGEDEVLVARKNGELDLTDDVTLLIESNSVVAPLKNEEWSGAYVIGGGTYSINTKSGKISGSFDKLWIVWRENNFWNEMIEELALVPASHIDIVNLGFVNKTALLDFVTKEVKRIQELIKEKKKSATHIKLPFLEIYDGPDKEIVKIGPLVVYESDKETYVSVGPMKILQEKKGKKSPERLAQLYVGIRDPSRGEILVKIAGDSLSVTTNEVKIESSTDFLKVVKGDNVVKKEGLLISVALSSGLSIKAEKNSYAKLTKNGTVVKADIDGRIKIIRKDKIYKIVDKALAEKIIDKIYNTAEKILERMTRWEEVKEVKELISFLDKIIKD